MFDNKGPEERVPVAEQEESVPEQHREPPCTLTGQSTIPKFLFSTLFSESSITVFMNFVIHFKNQIMNIYSGPAFREVPITVVFTALVVVSVLIYIKGLSQSLTNTKQTINASHSHLIF